MAFRPEPAYQHGRKAGTAIVLCNLGTPDAPTPEAVRSYLREFLGDPRVVEIPPMLWKPILHGIILRTRPAVSAKKYASIWTPEGSPLLTWTLRQADGALLDLTAGFDLGRGWRLGADASALLADGANDLRGRVSIGWQF